MSYVLVGLTDIQTKDKKYFKACVVDDDCNISDIFVSEKKFNELKNYIYKDIASIIHLQYIRETKSYKLAINSDK